MSSTAQNLAVDQIGEQHKMRSQERRVILASSIGTIFEWYDFYLYAILAPFFASLFFPPENQTAALLGAFGAYAAGFLVRPFGALIFGRLGDTLGRKYTFLFTIVIMGISTVLVGCLPTYETIGFAAPLLLIGLRLMQGLALGGEYGGAVTYVAEHSFDNKRGFATSWIQTTATGGMLMALIVIGLSRYFLKPGLFGAWGWRIPFLFSIILLIISIYIRLKLEESPIFLRMKSEGKGSKQPLRDSFFKYPNNKYVMLALFGATAGQGVVWYTGQFYALFFLQIYLKLDYIYTYILIGISLLVATPMFLVFGALSDKIGRKKIILAGCLLAALTYLPLFRGLTRYVNPDLEAYQQKTTISVAAHDCNFHIFIGPWSKQSSCDKAKDFLSKAGLSFSSLPGITNNDVVTKINNIEIIGFDEQKFKNALKESGHPQRADLSKVNWLMTQLILIILVLYVAMVYGPIAAYLVELFPARIRYTSMSLPYHIGNGWFGGCLPLLATALVAHAGNIYYGLWYPIIVAMMTFIIGGLFVKETNHVKFHDGF